MYEELSVKPYGHLPGGDFKIAWASDSMSVYCIVKANEDNIQAINESALALYISVRDQKKEKYEEKLQLRIIIAEDNPVIIGEQQWELEPIFNNGILINMNRKDLSREYVDRLLSMI